MDILQKLKNAIPYYAYPYLAPLVKLVTREKSLRERLPADYITWHYDSSGEEYHTNWETLRPFFKQHGFTLYRHVEELAYGPQDFPTPPAPDGFFFRSATAVLTNDKPHFYTPCNGRQHMVRASDNRSFIVSVVSVAGSGEHVLRILRRLSSLSSGIVNSHNHILPIYKELVFEDIHFLLYPVLWQHLRHTVVNKYENSLEDAVYLVMQALEAVAFLHSKNVAHRDAFFENFLVEWFPVSLAKTTCTRPRVYIIDFESAVDFGDAPASEMICHTLPFTNEDLIYKRPMAPELTEESLAYCPFKLDVWQLGWAITRALSMTGFAELDTMWTPMMDPNPQERPTVQEVLDKLVHFVRKTPPQELHVSYEIIREEPVVVEI